MSDTGFDLAMSKGPNPALAAASILRARRVSTPRPSGAEHVDHTALQPILDRLASVGISSLAISGHDIDVYRDDLATRSPDAMTPAGALAFWINLYNAGALRAAGVAYDRNAGSVMRVPGAFRSPWVNIDGEALSLEDIEHGKIRRFGDPRIHSALVCGSVSCPTLRHEPFVEDRIDQQLDDQMRRFVRSGGVVVDRTSGVVYLSRVLMWYGKDFTRPDAMPNVSPAWSGRLRDTIAWWLEQADREYVWREAPRVEFLDYDWGLSCAIAPAERTTP